MTGTPTLAPAEALAAVMTRIYEEGLTTPSGGNLSVLAADGGLWVTPSQVDKGRLVPASMVRIAADGSWQGGAPPTSEWPFHRAVLEARPDCRAVAHAHAPSLVAWSVVGEPLPLNQFPDLCRFVNRVAYSPYALPGSHQLGERLRAAFATGCDATLMENHGVVTCGRDLGEAFHRLDALEQLAKILLAGARLGPLRPLDEGQMAESRQRLAQPPTWESLTVDRAEQQAAREGLADCVRRAHRRRLVAARGSAFSCRFGQGFLITPDGPDPAMLAGGDLVYVAGEGCEAGRLPDATAPLHRAVYQAHAHVAAVATALPPNLMAFAASGVAFDTRSIAEAYIFLKAVPTLPFPARFAGAQVAEALGAGQPVVLIENACAVVTGASPFAVFDRLEVAELTARALLDAMALGRPRPLSDDLLAEVASAYPC
jgi:L-fuculose-phosphate aldolase